MGHAHGESSNKYGGSLFAAAINNASREIHGWAKSKGWWDEPRPEGELIALMHSELSEGLEALRAGDPPDDKIPAYNGALAELADVFIRGMDFAAAKGWDLGGAILAKMEYNETRPYRHGKKF